MQAGTNNDVSNLHHFITSNNHLNNLNQQLQSNHHHNLQLNNNNSASYNCIVVSKSTPHHLIPHHSATNLTTSSATSSPPNSGATPLCFNCKNHAHHSQSATKLSNSNTSLTNGTPANSSSNVYNRTKLEQSLNEAKRRVAQLKKELNHLQVSKQMNSNQYLSSLTNSVNSGLNGGEDQVDFVLANGTTSRESQLRMLKSYMQEAVESVYGSQSNSRHSSQQQLALPLIKQGLSSSSISTDSLRNSTSSVHLNHQLSNQQLNHHLHINHPQCNATHQCNHQVSTSDSFATENIYSNQQIINNLNKSRSANTINFKSSNNLSTGHNPQISVNNKLSNLSCNRTSPNSTNSLLNAPDQHRSDLIEARERFIQFKKDLDANHSTTSKKNSENYVIYTNQSAIAQQQKQLDLSQKINDPHANHQSPNDLLSIIDKYYRRNDNSTAVEV